MMKQFRNAIVVSIVLLFIVNYFIRVSGPGDEHSTGLIVEYLQSYSVSSSLIRAAFLVLIVFIIQWLYFYFRGLRIPNVGQFWSLVASNPDVAYEWFIHSPAWSVFEYPPPPDYRQKVPEAEWSGPFDLYVPSLGMRIQIFGRIGQYESSRESFINLVKNK